MIQVCFYLNGAITLSFMELTLIPPRSCLEHFDSMEQSPSLSILAIGSNLEDTSNGRSVCSRLLGSRSDNVSSSCSVIIRGLHFESCLHLVANHGLGEGKCINIMMEPCYIELYRTWAILCLQLGLKLEKVVYDAE